MVRIISDTSTLYSTTQARRPALTFLPCLSPSQAKATGSLMRLHRKNL